MKKFFVVSSLFLISLTSTSLAKERLSLGYIYGSSKTHSQIVENTRDSVNVVSPTYFSLNLDGRLEKESIIDEEFIVKMHEKNIEVTPFLSNHWGRERAKIALNNPEALVADIIEVVNEYNLDGINIDLENLPVSYKEKLTEFVRMLREAMPEGKTISVAVASNPNRLNTTWVASYDYEKLAQYSDYLVLMAYDEHCAGGAEGPVASIDFVRKSVEYMLETVSKDKIVLGIPLYGRFWEVSKSAGGEAIVIGQVENIIKKYKLVPTFDTKYMTPKLTVEVDGVMTNIYVNGRYLEPGTYNIWYENEHSIKTKLKIINEFNLKGSALWALDNEGKEFWNYYKSSLNETEYEDEAEIRIRQRLDSYAKILKVKPIFIVIDIPWEREKISLNDDAFAKIEEMKAFKYKAIELVIPDNKINLIRHRKLRISPYIKKYPTLKPVVTLSVSGNRKVA